MPRLSRPQQDAYHQIVKLADRGLSPQALGQQFLAVLETVVPSDGQGLFGVDPGSLLFNRLIASSQHDHALRIGYLRDVYLHGGPLGSLDFPALMRAGTGVVAIQPRVEISWGTSTHVGHLLQPSGYERAFQELGTPAGGVLRTCLAGNGRWVAGLDLYRRDSHLPFQAKDVAFLRVVAPLAAGAISASMRRERAYADAGRNAAVGSGVIILGHDRRVRFSTPIGEWWCDRTRELERGGGELLPTAVWSAVAQLRHAGDDRVSGSVLIPMPDTLLRVEATSGGEDGSIAVVMTPERTPTIPDIPDDWPLSPRQREIVRLLVGGFGNRELAERLFVSENTIETHLRQIYERLDVPSRGRLVARFFQETHWPMIEADRSDI